ncbi:metallophosphoesterase [Labilibaculum sp.]|uniref:metallophosphoesterase n=1 Tax=Labilibaculum sp. TaxID=2060723 RepID=UPI002AA6F3F7|nr:metallophosphoesterase [Labilibaculum sp.]MBN2595443.1 metallophosphoesterase [Marinifilaceae bacterium]
MQIKQVYIYLLLLLLLGSFQSHASFDQDTICKDSLIVASYVEGPHVRYISPTRVEAFYIVHDSIKNRTRKISKSFRFKNDTASFIGFAGHDTLTYIIPNKIEPEPGENPSNNRIVVLGDIHGEFESLLAILRYNKIIDKKNKWNYGAGQVVFTGDVFDRGDKVTECLWFIFQLEIQAKKQGGMVHYLLGNHEMMALLFDDRYVIDKYQHAAHHLQFHYSHFFDKHSVLGKWLRSKNTLVRIGEQLFVHGGISPKLLEKKMSINEVNVGMRYHLNNYTALVDTTLVDLFLYSNSPLWYRGYLSRTPKYDRISLQEVLKTLEFYHANVIIFGHTPVARVYPFYSFKLIAMDVPIGDPNYIDQGLLIENQKYYRIFAHKKKERLQ